MAFARFMASFWGRAIRVVAGLLLIWWGVTMGSVVGWVIALVGLVVTLAGLFNFCGLAPLFGGPFLAKDIPSTDAPAAQPTQAPQQPPQDMQQPGA